MSDSKVRQRDVEALFVFILLLYQYQQWNSGVHWISCTPTSAVLHLGESGGGVKPSDYYYARCSSCQVKLEPGLRSVIYAEVPN